MDLTSPEKRRVQKLRAGRRSPPPRRAIEDGDEEITRPDPPRPPAVRALSTGLNFKKAVRTVPRGGDRDGDASGWHLRPRLARGPGHGGE